MILYKHFVVFGNDLSCLFALKVSLCVNRSKKKTLDFYGNNKQTNVNKFHVRTSILEIQVVRVEK